jgi:hypothetical protein
LFREYTRAAVRYELPLAMKARCLIQVARWLKWGAMGSLVGDLAYYFWRPRTVSRT